MQREGYHHVPWSALPGQCSSCRAEIFTIIVAGKPVEISRATIMLDQGERYGRIHLPDCWHPKDIKKD